MIQAVLFELEGVLADTREARRTALLDALEEDGVVLSDTEYDEWCTALPVRSAVRAALALRDVAADETSIDLATVRAERHFSRSAEAGLSLNVGARSLIESMQGQTRLGIVSRASRRDIETTLSMAQLDYAFEFALSGDDAHVPKPSAEPYRAALERLARRRAVPVTTVVALEDGVAGIRSAKGAGIRCAVVGTPPIHVAIEADGLIPSLDGLTAATIDAVTLGKHTAGR
jgi:beta-phosphoglucomutase-like phosphatase (HAD superfamily)